MSAAEPEPPPPAVSPFAAPDSCPAPRPAGPAEDPPPPRPATVDPPLSRRRLLALATTGLGGVAGASLLGVGAAAALGTPLRRRPGSAAGPWADLGPLTRFPPGQPVKVPVVGQAVDAWTRFDARPLGAAIVVRGEGGQVRVLSAVCPHNGCDVVPTGEQRPELLCPCHDSRFDPDGTPRAGPSPRALDPLEHELREGRLWVRWARFQPGTAERRPL